MDTSSSKEYENTQEKIWTWLQTRILKKGTVQNNTKLLNIVKNLLGVK